jgi:hypothetical protein
LIDETCYDCQHSLQQTRLMGGEHIFNPSVFSRRPVEEALTRQYQHSARPNAVVQIFRRHYDTYDSLPHTLATLVSIFAHHIIKSN